ncbi:MAG: peptidoglycan-binding protein [Myxococcales bacterium]|nr:peptidoglycan-binding protein [Myxococcales bacterium]MCB9737426.1 peptidoglycan-binding protein [Deltaproteobacteria bacterium]
MGFVQQQKPGAATTAPLDKAEAPQQGKELAGKDLAEQDAMLKPGAGGLASARFQSQADFGKALAGALYLKPGHGNKEAVSVLQESLTSMGFALGTIDGLWGNATTGALKQFQSTQGAKADAIIGPNTMGALDKADAASGSKPVPKAKEKEKEQAKAKGGGGDAAGPAPVSDKTKGAPPAKGGGQTDNLEEKKAETKSQVKEKPTPEVMSKKESEFASEGQAALSQVEAAGGGSLTGGGDTKGAGVEGYPQWFVDLQDKLVNSASWSDTHEKAQNVLYRYAMWKTEADLGYVPASVEYFFRYIGKSDGNNAAAKKAGKKGAEDLGGYGNAKNWCAQATTMAAEKSLKERGLKFKGGIGAWIQAHAGKKTAGSYWCTRANGVELTAGDQVSYLGKNHNNTTGHRVTVLENLGGGKFLHVSGNAGGGGSGSVRIGTSTRSDVPADFVPGGKLTQAHAKPTDDTVWVYSLQKTGDVFSELAKLDGIPATDPRYDGLLKELGLERTTPSK